MSMSIFATARAAGSRRREPGARRRPSGARRRLMWTVPAWAAGLLFIAPIAFMVLTSFHSELDATTNPPSVLAPLTLDGYRTFLGLDGGQSPVAPLLNSLTASVGSTVLVLVLALPAAYALAIRPVQKWSDVLFFFLSTKFLPLVAGLLPLYFFARATGLLDDINFLLVLYAVMNLPIAIWMLRSFLAEVPIEMLEAAQLDGAGLITILRRVIAPVALPGIAATALICFIFSWNEMLLARTFTSIVAGTAPVFLTGFASSRGLFLAQLCAAATAISLPVLIAGFAAQDKLVQGLSLGAVK